MKFFGHPVFEGLHALGAAQEIFDEVVGGHGAAGFEDDAAVAEGSVAGERIVGVELGKEVFGDDLVPHVGVVGGRVACEVAEGGPHVSAGSGGEERVAAGIAVVDGIEVDGGGI